MLLDEIRLPIVLAPMAGGPSTPELAASVSEAGGLGFLAGGNLTAIALAQRLAAVRAATGRPFGVNLFVPQAVAASPVAVARYAAALADEAAAAGVALGVPAPDDDDFAAKAALLLESPPAVVSFTFGLPDAALVGRLRDAGAEVWITVTTPAEATDAAAVGADALVVQGGEAGGHRGGPGDDPAQVLGLLPLLQLVRAAVDLPIVAAGGIATGAAIAAVLILGARAAAVGTAFLDCPEAGTSAVHRTALHGSAPTALTRAFTGRTARGIANRFLRQHSAAAPAAYPAVHHLTAPLRAAARASGDAEVVSLWAGQAYPLIRSLPAAELVAELAAETSAALSRAASRSAIG